jgi:phospholipase C
VGHEVLPFWHPFGDGDVDAVGIPLATPSFIDTCAAGNLPNVSFIDPAFDTEGNGTSADDHPLADIRLGERFIADAYHALANAGYLDNTVFVVTFDEWGGFFDHVPPPHVIDDTNPADVDHTGDSTTPTDGQLIPDYTQLGFRVPAIVVSNLARPRVVHHGPFEHTSTLKLIETTFGLQTMTARDAHALNLGLVLGDHPRPGVPAGAIPTSSQVPGPANDAAAVCSATSVQSVSPPPARFGEHPGGQPYVAGGWPAGSGMAGLGDQIKKNMGA